MSERITAPWSSEQVAALEAFQTASGMHPFTCGAGRHSLPPRLTPSHSGWYCPDPACDYQQDWAHAFMTNPSAWTTSYTNPPGSNAEQLPADVLALLAHRTYLSTACETARLLDGAIIRNGDCDDLPAWRDRMHGRCRLNNKFTGNACSCHCHPGKP